MKKFNLDDAVIESANILADVELGRNLGNHLQDVTDCIKQINETTDQASKLGDQNRGYKVFGYELYRLKDLILDKLNGKS